MAWFSLTGTNPTNPAHYTLQSSQPSCPGTEQICAIQAAQDGSGPDLTPALLAEMVIALNDQTPSGNVKLKDRPVR